MPEHDPISFEHLQKCFSSFSQQDHIGLAISGGPDSMALLLLVDRWRTARVKARQKVPELVLFTVDHGLRDTAAQECALVMERAAKLGHEGEVLRWDWQGEPPETRVQEQAREIRYQLLAAACHSRGIKCLLTAHHLDDQAETFLMRLARGSGVDGLGAMTRESRHYGLQLVRPLLAFPKAVLLEELRIAGWQYVTDPSNKDLRFERVRMREHREQFEALGLSARMIALSAERLQRARAALERGCERFLTDNALISDYGTARIDQLALADAPDEIGVRALAKVLRICGGRSEDPNMARLERLLEKLKDDFSTNRTLAGCRLIAKGDFWLIVREAGRIVERQKPLVPGGCMFWDARYIICADSDVPDTIEVGPLLLMSSLLDDKAQKKLHKLPKEAIASLLVLWEKGEVLAVPAIDYWRREELCGQIKVRFVTRDDGLGPVENQVTG